MPNAPVAQPRSGTTLIELLMVLAVIGILMTMTIALYSREPSPTQAANDAAYALAHGIEAIRTDGLVAHTTSEITTSGILGDSMDVHFLKLTSGGTSDVQLISDSKRLRENIRYGAGVATVGPTGDNITEVAPVLVTCTPQSSSLAACYIGSLSSVPMTATTMAAPITYYLTVEGHGTVVRAVVISPRGEVTIYHYDPATGGWN